MSKKNHRSGGKFGGSHTTVIPAAGLMADLAAGLDEVTKVIPGLIKQGLKPVSGQRRPGMRVCIFLLQGLSPLDLKVILYHEWPVFIFQE